MRDIHGIIRRSSPAAFELPEFAGAPPADRVGPMPRFLVPDLAPGTEIELPSGEARHAAKSRRLKTGDEVTLFDGRGKSCAGRIVRVDGARVAVRVGDAAAEIAGRVVTIASALPKW